MAISDLLQTDMQLAGLVGQIEEQSDCYIVRTPHNPGFFYGNFVVLKQEPTELERWLSVFEDAFGKVAEHRCLAWSGSSLSDELMVEAEALDLALDGSVEMCLEAPPPVHSAWQVRPLTQPADWDASVALNRECDASEQAGEKSYRLFKERLRATWVQWFERDLATWWGAFDGDKLVAQCGMVPCGELGRFQSVETHPDWQRRGVCSHLMATVARAAFENQGFRRLLLAAEVAGPALGLYERLGFVDTGRTHSLLRRDSKLTIRAETNADNAGVRSLVTAAFGTPEAAQLIAVLRSSPDSISLVADHSSSLQGHILFSRVTIETEHAQPSATALAPLAVRPTAQRRGVGTALVTNGLEQCKLAGFELCLVIGNPAYYSRFGFVPATEHGLTHSFNISDEQFMVCELAPGALAACAGKVVYPSAFGAS